MKTATATPLAGLFLACPDDLTEGDLAAIGWSQRFRQYRLTDRACSDGWVRVTGVYGVAEETVRVEGVYCGSGVTVGGPESPDGPRLFSQIVPFDRPLIAREGQQ